MTKVSIVVSSQPPTQTKPPTISYPYPYPYLIIAFAHICNPYSTQKKGKWTPNIYPYNPINVCSLLKSNTNTFCRTQHIRTTEDDGGRHQDRTGRSRKSKNNNNNNNNKNNCAQ